MRKIRSIQPFLSLQLSMNSSAINLNKFWRPVLIAATVVFLYAQVLAKLGRDWWTDENYSHGILVPFVIGFIIWTEFEELKKAAGSPQIWIGFALILFALLMLLGGTLGSELFTQRASLVLMFVGIIIYFFGRQILQFLVVPFALLIFSIPIPQIVFNKIAFPLQIWASQAAVWGIRAFEVASVRKGNVIEILPRGATQVIALEVVEACSGIRSLMTLVTLALVLAYFTREKSKDDQTPFWKGSDFWRALILMFSAVPIAILTNAGRVTATGVLTYYYGKRATESFWHELAGWLVYVVALVLLLSINFGLKYISRKFTKPRDFSQTPANAVNLLEEAEAPEIGISAASSYPAGLRLSSSVSLLICVLFLGGLFINWLGQRGEIMVERRPLAEIPAKIGEWQQKGDEIRFSEQTESVLRATDYTMRVYYSFDDRPANIYVGYYASQRSGATYHSPQNCLPGAGWVMKEPEFIEIKTPGGKTFTANRFIVENGVYKEVLIYWYEGRGRTEASEYRDKINTVWDSVLRKRSDGAMVRVMTTVGNDEQAATQAAINLSGELADKLSAFIPE